MAVTEMDNVTQQNASLVEEASSAAASLEEQAARLTQAVSAFKLSGAAVATVKTSSTGTKPKILAAPRPALATTNNEHWETF